MGKVDRVDSSGTITHILPTTYDQGYSAHSGGRTAAMGRVAPAQQLGETHCAGRRRSEWQSDPVFRHTRRIWRNRDQLRRSAGAMCSAAGSPKLISTGPPCAIRAHIARGGPPGPVVKAQTALTQRL